MIFGALQDASVGCAGPRHGLWSLPSVTGPKLDSVGTQCTHARFPAYHAAPATLRPDLYGSYTLFSGGPRHLACSAHLSSPLCLRATNRLRRVGGGFCEANMDNPTASPLYLPPSYYQPQKKSLEGSGNRGEAVYARPLLMISRCQEINL
jgi:hypothetical protein